MLTNPTGAESICGGEGSDNNRNETYTNRAIERIGAGSCVEEKWMRVVEE